MAHVITPSWIKGYPLDYHNFIRTNSEGGNGRDIAVHWVCFYMVKKGL